MNDKFPQNDWAQHLTMLGCLIALLTFLFCAVVIGFCA